MTRRQRHRHEARTLPARRRGMREPENGRGARDTMKRLLTVLLAAMLALPFTILTNALSGGHMGTYLGLFNGTICIPQIVAAALGGSILALFTPKGMLPPEINMLVMAGVMLIIGAVCVYLIKETKGERS